ncbi:MAG: hypothetical protein PUC44_02720 [Eubacteriales bacterium]|nr:hypothetical protein [Eubacteriales bacterium]
MNERFQVIEGGLSEAVKNEEWKAFTLADGSFIGGRFLSLEEAWITDTRLMGVFVMGLAFRRAGNPDGPVLREYFYFDAAYFGFDRFEFLIGGDEEEWKDMENSFVGGLGGGKQPVSRKEAAWILARYLRKTKNFGLEPPADHPEYYRFLEEEAMPLTAAEKEVLWKKACKPAASDYERANYYLIRLCDRDLDGIYYVSGNRKLYEEDTLEDAPHVLESLGPEFPKMTMFQSDLEFEFDGSVTARFIAGTDDERFWLFVAMVRLGENHRISESRILSSMKISAREAMMNTIHPEYILVLRYDLDPDAFERHSTALTERAMILAQDTGVLFMMYYEDNSHVDQKHYRIYDDLLGAYFMTAEGQLIAAANSLSARERLEQDLGQSWEAEHLTPVFQSKFDRPVLSTFVQSGYTDFLEFLMDQESDQ